MNREDIIRMARECGLPSDELYHPNLERFAALVAAAAIHDDLLWQAERPWVGLTKHEFNECVDGLEDLEDCWTAIEAKLRSKNT